MPTVIEVCLKRGMGCPVQSAVMDFSQSASHAFFCAANLGLQLGQTLCVGLGQWISFEPDDPIILATL